MNKIVICFLSFAVAGNIGVSISSAKNRTVATRYGRDYEEKIAPTANTHWGDWGYVDFCPDESFAAGFTLKVEDDGDAADDTALNGIRQYCVNPTTNEGQGSITSTVGSWGDWGSRADCPTGAMFNAAQFRSETSYWYLDDTAGNDLNMRCTDGTVIYGNGGQWGTWSSWVQCEANTAICGMQTRVEPPQSSGDDTALNEVTFFCCASAQKNPQMRRTMPKEDVANIQQN